MKRLLIITSILLALSASAWAWGVVGISGGVAAPAGGGDTCGVDDCTFIWYAEEHATANESTITGGSPAGCSSGDTVASLTGASIETTQYHDGTHSLYISGTQEYASIAPAAIMSSASGTVEFWIYIGSWINGAQCWRYYYDSNNYIFCSMIGGSNTDIEFRFRVYYPPSGTITVDTTAVNGGLNTWYRVVCKWDADAANNVAIEVFDAEGTQLDAPTPSTTDFTFANEATTINIGCNPYYSGTLQYYMDGVKIWNAWKD